eukprot:s425_g11.t1
MPCRPRPLTLGPSITYAERTGPTCLRREERGEVTRGNGADRPRFTRLSTPYAPQASRDEVERQEERGRNDWSDDGSDTSRAGPEAGVSLSSLRV